MTSIIFNDCVSIKTLILPKQDNTIEDYLNRLVMQDIFDKSLVTSKEEWNINDQVIRASLNYCLLMDEVGVKEKGQHELKRCTSSKTGPTRHQPNVYELNQVVKLVKTVRSHSELGEPTGKILPPHHRRGYYRMQPYGPKNSLRKRIRISPVFVNSHLFVGDMKKTMVTYV